jgi:hypothetical protein
MSSAQEGKARSVERERYAFASLDADHREHKDVEGASGDRPAFKTQAEGGTPYTVDRPAFGNDR